MATGDKRIPQLARKGASSALGSLAIYDPVLDDTVQIKVQETLGAVQANMDWQAATTYAAGDFVLYLGQTAWRSLVSSNTGNVPAENSFWTAETISTADGITDTQWAAGLFTYDDSKVVVNNAQYYLQTAAPFKSSNFATELVAGDWAAASPSAVDTFTMIPQATPPAHTEAMFYYDDVKKNFVFYNDRTDPSMDIGRELWTRAVNKTGTATTNGKAVYISGVTGTLPNVQLAKADATATAKVIGVYTEDVAIDGNGEVVGFGLLHDFDTSSFTSGDILYLSSATAGEITNVRPTLPNHVIVIGYCIYSHATEGRIWVNFGEAFTPIWQSVNSSWSAFAGSTVATNYVRGFYTFETAVTFTGTPTTMGTANLAYAAHVYFVLGAASTDMVLRVSGTSYDDSTGRTAADTQDIDTSGGVLDDYFETTKKWIGQVSITLLSGTGVIATYGWASYWDNRNTVFMLSSVEWTGRAGANDAAPNLQVWHHKSTGWTYGASGATPPAPVVDMQSDFVTEYQFGNGQYFKYKKTDLAELIDGPNEEGILIGITITANNAVATSTVEFQIISSLEV